MTTGAFSRNISKLFSKLKLVPDNLLFIYVEANCEATERKQPTSLGLTQAKFKHDLYIYAISSIHADHKKNYLELKTQEALSCKLMW